MQSVGAAAIERPRHQAIGLFWVNRLVKATRMNDVHDTGIGSRGERRVH